MKNLTEKTCKPCEGGMPPLKLEQAKKYLFSVPDWKIVGKKITKKYKFDDFKKSLSFVNKVGEIAEKEGHHPDITFGWGYVTITLTTHAVKGLSENDFILAAKINEIKS